MKAIFAHDHLFKEDIQGDYYTGACYNHSVWNRYLKHFKEIKVIARLDGNKIPLDNEYNKFKLSNLFFKSVPTMSGPISQFKNKRKVTETITKALKDADVLIARLPSETGDVAIKIAEKLNKPYLVEVVGCIWDSLWNYGSLQAKVYAPFAMTKMKKSVKNAPYAIYVTNDFLQKRYPSKGKTESVSNVEIEKVNINSIKNRIERYNRNGKLFTIGTIGSLDNKIKGLHIAFKAMKILNKSGIDFQFRILGAGNQAPWKSKAKNLGIENQVRFEGLLPGGNPVLEWLDDIDIYIQPSYQEGLPRAVIEAMSRGCPVVGSSAGGIPELIDYDCIHKPGDHVALSRLLRNIMCDVSKATFLTEQNGKTSQNYIKNILDNKRSTLLESLINSHIK